MQEPHGEVQIAMVGKYMDLADSYISLVEALVHAGAHHEVRVKVHYVDAQDLERDGNAALKGMHGVLVPGGFGQRGIDGKIGAVRFARENMVPFFGICLGMQIALIEFARNVLHLAGANSTEFDKDAAEPIIGLVTEWMGMDGKVSRRSGDEGIGGTMRLGSQPCRLQPGSLAQRLYATDLIHERHRHRYEFNNGYRQQLTDAGMHVIGESDSGGLAEIVELSGHPWFLACQFHPEFQSTPRDSHPLFKGFIKAALDCAGAGAKLQADDKSYGKATGKASGPVRETV